MHFFLKGAFNLTEPHSDARMRKHGPSLSVMPWTKANEFNVIPKPKTTTDEFTPYIGQILTLYVLCPHQTMQISAYIALHAPTLHCIHAPTLHCITRTNITLHYSHQHYIAVLYIEFNLNFSQQDLPSLQTNLATTFLAAMAAHAFFEKYASSLAMNNNLQLKAVHKFSG